MHELDGAKLKVKRAKAHIDNLHRRISRFMAKTEYALVEDIDPQSLKKTYHIAGDTLPMELGTVIADIVTNLRSSLDFIAWELSTYHTKTITERQARGIIFPLLDVETTGTIDGLCKFMDPDAIGVVKECQPYNRSQWPELDLLWTLQELSRIARHRIVTETMVFASLHIKYQGRSTDLNLAKGEGEEIVLHSEASIESPENLYPRFPLDIAFTVQTQGKDRIPAFSVGFLNDTHQFIRDEVIPRFSRFFPK